MNDIILIKLISGEELIGTMVGEDTVDTIRLKDTVTIAYHPSGEGKMSAGFAPHMPYAEGTLTLFKSAVAFKADVKEDMLNEYKRIFGHIIIPTQSIVGA